MLDPVLRGFAAIALGGAKEPLETRALMDAVDRGGNAVAKPFCAIALGLSARSLGKDGDKIRKFLIREFDKANDIELSSALAVALGLARAKKATKQLLARVMKRSKPAPVRGAAAQGLGIMRSSSAEVAEALETILRKERSPQLLQDVALSLGLMGRRAFGIELARMIPKTKSVLLQGRLMLALAHLGHGAAVEPLLELLKNRNARTLTREFAAVALGILGDRRDEDLLFSLDAYFNYFATTPATNEWLRLY